MTTPRQGRHSRPPSESRATADRLLDRVLDEANRRWLRLAGAVAGAVVFAVAGLLVLPEGGPSRTGSTVSAPSAAPRRTATPAPGTTSMTADPANPGDPDQVPEAVAFLRVKDPEARYVKHVTEVRRSGTFLRVYTDLRENQANSKPAIRICEWTTEFLRGQAEDEPVVFVHAKENDNGNVVLANKQSATDDCKVGG